MNVILIVYHGDLCGEWEIHDKSSFKAKERVVRAVWDLYDNTSCRGAFQRNHPVNISLRLHS